MLHNNIRISKAFSYEYLLLNVCVIKMTVWSTNC